MTAVVVHDSTLLASLLKKARGRDDTVLAVIVR